MMKIVKKNMKKVNFMNRIEKYLFTKYKRMVRKQMGGNEDLTISQNESVPELSMPLDLVSGGSCSAKKCKTNKKTTTKSTKPKSGKKGAKGGALVEDIKSLAVPFAILLAKEGLEKMFKDKKKTTKTESAKKSTATRRKATVGGDCTSCGTPMAPMKGGSKKSKYAKLSEEIDNFLKDY